MEMLCLLERLEIGISPLKPINGFFGFEYKTSVGSKSVHYLYLRLKSIQSDISTVQSTIYSIPLYTPIYI